MFILGIWFNGSVDSFSENIIMEQLDFFKKYDNSMYQN